MNIKSSLFKISVIVLSFQSCNLEQNIKTTNNKEEIIENAKDEKLNNLLNSKDTIINNHAEKFITESKYTITEEFKNVSNFIWSNKDENKLYFIYSKGISKNNKIALILYSYDVKYNFFNRISEIFYIEADKIKKSEILNYIGSFNINFDDDNDTFLYYDNNKGIIKKQFNSNSEYLLNLGLLDNGSISRNLKYQIYTDKSEKPIIKYNYENKKYFVNRLKDLSFKNKIIKFLINSDKYVDINEFSQDTIFNIESNEFIKIPQIKVSYDTLNDDIYYFSDKLIKYNIKEDRTTNLGDYLNKDTNLFHSIKLSRNGKYVSYIGVFGEEKKSNWQSKLVIFNIESKEYKILDIYELEKSEMVTMFDIAY
ncbi:MAG: hypothetical protein U0457_03525 [Candidatus Sericytochromatia bacterium]